jgi:hypothetical protein
MMVMNRILIAAALTLALPAAGWAQPSDSTAGDIPDTQAFVRYVGPGYSVLVPEGWSRAQRGSTVTFAWNANGETIEVSAPGDPQPELRSRFGASGAIVLRRATIAGSPAVIATFASQSKPNAVTGKRVRLDNAAYIFERGGRRAMLVLSAPAGADNADQWKKISESFRWK